MKTAMQELIDEMCSINWHLYSFNDKMKVVNVYLEKEKDQIIDAHFAGWGHAYDYYITEADSYSSEPIQAEDYYNETYTQNK
jgi:hypothetical protein